jgi:hypothetical protein
LELTPAIPKTKNNDGEKGGFGRADVKSFLPKPYAVRKAESYSDIKTIEGQNDLILY